MQRRLRQCSTVRRRAKASWVWSRCWWCSCWRVASSSRWPCHSRGRGPEGSTPPWSIITGCTAMRTAALGTTRICQDGSLPRYQATSMVANLHQSNLNDLKIYFMNVIFIQWNEELFLHILLCIKMISDELYSRLKPKFIRLKDESLSWHKASSRTCLRLWSWSNKVDIH